VSGPFMFDIGPLRVQASTLRKPMQVVIFSLIVAMALSPGVRSAIRQWREVGFYVVAALLAWLMALGPMTSLMGAVGIPGPFQLIMRLPGVNSLRVPARFWLMATLCLAVLVALVLAEMLRGRSRRLVIVAMLIASAGVLADGWIDRIKTAAIPPPLPNENSLAGAIVFEVPPDSLTRDIRATYRAVNGGWKTINGYSGWAPSYFGPLIGAGRADVADLVTPFQQFGDMHVLVGQDAPRLRSIIEQQPGVTLVASDTSVLVYRLPKREVDAMPIPRGQRLHPRALISPCSSELLKQATDNDESTLWQCALWDERGFLTIDLGDVQTVGSVVNNLGYYSWLYPGALFAETSTDGATWSPAWGGNVRERSILAAMADPKHLRIVLAFPSRPARYIRLRAQEGAPDVPWALAELEVWSSSSESR
jgi:hypothetical protein